MIPRSFLKIEDFADDEIDWILKCAGEMSVGAAPARGAGGLLGLLFLEASLRTRVGFAAAASRLGWQFVDVGALRSSPSSVPERWEDTIRTLTGYCDLVVARLDRALIPSELSPHTACPIVNGGDVGPVAEHPTQALIDLFAMERFCGPIEELRIAVVGDIRMRAAASLLSILGRRKPAEILAVTDPGYLTADDGEPGLLGVPTTTILSDAEEADVVYVVGMPHRSIPSANRQRLIITTEFVESLRPDTVVLSPMPVLDEIDREAWADQRVRFNEQSDLAAFVRMAVIEFASSELGLCDVAK